MKFYITLLISSFLISAGANTIIATTGSYIDVSNAVASASNGDTVVVPNGVWSWNKTLTISGITLQGGGSNNCTVIDNTTLFASLQTIIIHATNGFLSRVTGFQFTYTNTTYNNFNGMIEVAGRSPFWRVDNCYFNVCNAKCVLVRDEAYGLIDDNLFKGCSHQYIEIFGANSGDDSWAAADTMGTTNTVVVESNVFYDPCRFGSMDTDSGGRVCARYNTFNGSFFTVHGTETGTRVRGCRQLEVYNNTFMYPPSGPYDDFYTTCDIRGGTGVIFSNTMVNYYSGITLNAYRETDNNPQYAPFYGATGLNGFDSNSPPVLTGIASATSNKLFVASANWTPNQWVSYTVYNTNPINGNVIMGIATGNDSKTISFKGAVNTPYNFYITNGQGFTIYQTYPNIDMLGRGQGNNLGNTNNPFPAWPQEKLDPLYFWSNNLTVFYTVSTTISADASSAYPNVQVNRDFFNGIKPAYIPLVYPHPMIPQGNVGVTNTVQMLGRFGQISNMQ